MENLILGTPLVNLTKSALLLVKSPLFQETPVYGKSHLLLNHRHFPGPCRCFACSGPALVPASFRPQFADAAHVVNLAPKAQEQPGNHRKAWETMGRYHGKMWV